MEMVSLCFEVVNILHNPQPPGAADVWKPESDADLNHPGPRASQAAAGSGSKFIPYFAGGSISGILAWAGTALRASHKCGKKAKFSERKRRFRFRLQFQPNTWPSEVGCFVVPIQQLNVVGVFPIAYQNGS